MAGFTVKLGAPVIAYVPPVPAPDGVIIKDEPVQIEPLVALMVGNAFTVTVACAVLLDTQPSELVPVTE